MYVCMYVCVSANLHILVNTSYSEKASIVQTDPDKTVCLTALETLEDMLKAIRADVSLEQQTLAKLCSAISSVLDQKVIFEYVQWSPSKMDTWPLGNSLFFNSKVLSITFQDLGPRLFTIQGVSFKNCDTV